MATTNVTMTLSPDDDCAAHVRLINRPGWEIDGSVLASLWLAGNTVQSANPAWLSATLRRLADDVDAQAQTLGRAA